jgi:hypothetical protein
MSRPNYNLIFSPCFSFPFRLVSSHTHTHTKRSPIRQNHRREGDIGSKSIEITLTAPPARADPPPHPDNTPPGAPLVSPGGVPGGGPRLVC